MQKVLARIPLVFLIVTLLFLCKFSYSFAATYYVDINSVGGTCNNANAGTLITAPVCSLSTGHTKASAGDTVYVRAGTYPSVTFTKDGTSGSRITFSAYNDEEVIVDAAGVGNGIWMDRTNYFTLSGFKVINAGGDYDAGIKIGRFESGTISTVGNIVEDCVVEDSLNGSNNVYGIIIQNGASNIVRNCTVSGSYLSGITVLVNGAGAASNNEIRNNTSFNNTGSGGDSDGIKLEGATVTGTIVANNIVYGNSDDGIDTWTSNNNTIEYNISYNHNGSGDGNGFKMGGSTTGGSNLVQFNISYNNKANGFDSNGSGGNIYYHNVAYDNDNFGFEDSYRNVGASGSGTFINNIGYANALRNISAGSDTDTSDYNLWYSSGGSIKAAYNSTVYTTIAAYRTASGLDTNSIAVDPLFENAAGADFDLQSGSPAIDAGDPDNPASITTSGSAPDIGTYEYDQSAAATYSDSTKDTMTRQKISTLSSHTLVVNMSSGVNFASGDTLIFTFKDGAGSWTFPANTAWTTSDFAFNDGTARTIVATGASPSCSAGVNNVIVTADQTNKRLTVSACSSYTSSTDGANITFTIGSAAGGTDRITNPETLGSYEIWITGSYGDEQTEADVPILNDDQVSVTATVDTYITFGVSTTKDSDNEIDLGELTFTSVTSSNSSRTANDGSSILADNISLTLDTNAKNGTVIAVKSANAGLASTAAGYTLTSASETLAANQDTISGTAGYGIQAQTASTTAGTLTKQTPFDGSTTAVGAVSNSYTSIYETPTSGTNAPIVGGSAIIYVLAVPAKNTPPAGDYADTLTFRATATY